MQLSKLASALDLAIEAHQGQDKWGQININFL